MADARSAMFRLHMERLDIPLGLLAALITLIIGLSLPVMQIKKLIFWKDSYTIIIGALNLFKEGYYFLAAVIFIFSVVFPTVKLLGLASIWFVPMSQQRRERGVWWLAVLGKWSMLDVFVVAVTVVLSKSKALGDVSPQIGLYIFAASVLISMIVAILIERAVRQEQ